METRVFESNPEEKKLKLFHFDHTTGGFAIETIQDVEDVIEANKAEYNDADNQRWEGDMRKVGSIPLTIYYELKAKGWLPEQDQKAFLKWMHDPENRYFRTKSGRLG